MSELRAVTSTPWPPSSGSDNQPVVILLHGYGSHEQDLAGLATMLPGAPAWASLRAPLEIGGGAAAWYPIPNLQARPDTELVTVATAAVWSWIDAHVPEECSVIPLGFSQGGFMALQLLRTRPERVASTVVLSGYTDDAKLPLDDAIATSRPRVFWGRGDADAVIPPALVRVSESWLRAHVDVRARVYAGLGHGVNDAVMTDVRDFLSSHLSGSTP